MYVQELYHHLSAQSYVMYILVKPILSQPHVIYLCMGGWNLQFFHWAGVEATPPHLSRHSFLRTVSGKSHNVLPPKSTQTKESVAWHTYFKERIRRDVKWGLMQLNQVNRGGLPSRLSTPPLHVGVAMWRRAPGTSIARAPLEPHVHLGHRVHGFRPL